MEADYRVWIFWGMLMFNRLSPAMRASVLVTLMRMSGIALQALTLILLTHVLPPAPLGLYATVYACTTIMRLLGPVGFDQLALRGLLPGGDGVGPWDAAALVALGNAVLAILLGLVAWTAGAPFTPLQILLVAALLPAFALSGVLTGQVRGTGGVIAAQWPESVLLPLLIAIGLLAGHVAGGLTLTRALAGLFMAAWITTAVYAWLTCRREGGAIRRPVVARARPLTREGGAIFVALFFTAMSARAPMLLALPVLGPVGAALMEVANRFGTLGSVVSSSVATTYSPLFARAAEANDRNLMWISLRQGALLSGISGIAITIILAVFFPFASNALLPKIYYEAYIPLIILSISTAINCGFGLASNLMFMSGETSQVRKKSFMQTIFIYASSIILGSKFGATGIAISCLGGSLLRDGQLFFTCYKLLKKS